MLPLFSGKRGNSFLSQTFYRERDQRIVKRTRRYFRICSRGKDLTNDIWPHCPETRHSQTPCQRPQKPYCASGPRRFLEFPVPGTMFHSDLRLCHPIMQPILSCLCRTCFCSLCVLFWVEH